jgi:hypothetical protein
VRTYADFSRPPAGFPHPTPDLGEHSTILLAELGLSPDRIASLLATGAIFEPAQSRRSGQIRAGPVTAAGRWRCNSARRIRNRMIGK